MTRALRLRTFGLHVISQPFPCDITETFDMVLASHALPEDGRLYDPFVDCAWQLVKRGGTFLTISFKGASGAISEISRRVLGRATVIDARLHQKLLNALASKGTPVVERFSSKLSSRSSSEIATAVATTLGVQPGSNGFKAILEIVEGEFRAGDTYSIPYEHVCISITKPLSEATR